LKSRESRLAKGEGRAIAAALLSLLLASCTSSGDVGLNATVPGYNAGAAETGHIAATQPGSAATSPAATAPQTLMAAEGGTPLPDMVAYLPSASPGAGFPVPAPADAAGIVATTPPALKAGAEVPPPSATETASATPAQPPAQQQATAAAPAQPAMDNPVYVTAGEMPSEPIAPKKKSFLSSLFGGSASAAPAPQPKAGTHRSGDEAQPAAKPIITLASAEPGEKPVTLASVDKSSMVSSDNALPGVRQTALFEIKRKSGLDDDSDVDINEDEGGSYQVASAAGMARLAPNGLLKQNEEVDVACLKPSLVRVLKTIEGHYGRKVVVTSGYRNLDRNVRARGAKNSLHMYCAAADIQVQGVSKWELASYVRSMPGRGGVGTYCHTESVHVDVGPERDWNWRCRRRK
jgi:uncharacterized protein YcbK (DUF882 family)